MTPSTDQRDVNSTSAQVLDPSSRFEESLNRLLGLFYLARAEQAQTQRHLNMLTADPMLLMSHAQDLTQRVERAQQRAQDLGRALIELAWLAGGVSQALQHISSHQHDELSF